MNQSAIISSIDGMRAGFIRGWVLANGAGGASLLVTCDNERIAQIYADLPRPDVANRFAAPNNCGFQFRPVAELCRSVPRSYGFILLPHWIELSGSPCVTSFYDPRFARLSIRDRRDTPASVDNS